MTFRPPVTKPQRRRSRQVSVRRSLYMNIAFAVVTVASLALLGGVVFGYYYADHWAPVSSVNGVAISKDDVRGRAAVNEARYERQIENFQVMRNQAAITSDEYASVSGALTQKLATATLYQEALGQLQGDQVVQQYADKNGIRVSDEDVDAQIAKDATLEEMRHVKVIAVDAKATPPASSPTQAEIAAARAKAEGYLTDLKSSKPWDDVYTASTKDGAAGQEGANTGDLGLVTRDKLQLDPGLVEIVFGLAKEGEISAVFEGEDGVFRIATVTKIMAAYKDPGWTDAVHRNADSGAYRSAARAEALRAAVRKSIEAKLVYGATTARRVQEIAVSPGFGGSGSEYKLKLMVFAPNHKPSEASSLKADDPAWAEAKKRADEAHAALQKDVEQFATLAKDSTKNDEPYFADRGGNVPWLTGDVIYDFSGQGQSLGMPALRTALMDEKLESGLMAPIQEPGMGWVVAVFQGSRPSPAMRVATAQLSMAMGDLTFDAAITKYSESADATRGGDMGWIARYQLPPMMEQAVFGTPIGSVSPTVTTAEGFWIFKVVAEETRVADADDQAKLKLSVWQGWLTEQTAAANIWTDKAAVTALAPAPATGQ